MSLDYAVRSLLGRRKEQEDSIAIAADDGSVVHDEAAEGRAKALTLALADGMGGQAAGGVAKVHQAALAYARLHGQTDEQNIDRQVVKAELDALMDELQHDDIWNAREVQTLEIMRNLAMYKRERETVPETPFRGRSGRGRDNDGR